MVEPDSRLLEFVLNKCVFLSRKTDGSFETSGPTDLTFDAAYNIAASIVNEYPGWTVVQLTLETSGDWVMRLAK